MTSSTQVTAGRSMECGNTTRPYPLIPQLMNGTGALRQFVPRSLGIDPGRPWRDPGERAPTRRLKLRAIPIASSSKRRSAFNPASRPEGFRQYAEEAVRWARKSKTEQEKQALMDLACTWTQAAVQSEYIFGRQRQSARAQSSVRGPQLSASSGGSMDTTTLVIIIIVLLILFGGGWYGRGRWF
jgi:hypothetical protein